jgi:acyl dehydratase
VVNGIDQVVSEPASPGTTWESGYSWTSRDALLYALGVGAGPTELAFTTENSTGVEQRVLPTFAVLMQDDEVIPPLRHVPISALLHGEQSVALPGPLPVSGTARVTGRVVAVLDKGRDAHVRTETVVTDASDGRTLARTASTIVLRDRGGYGGERGTTPPWDRPAAAPDDVVTTAVRPEQALFYRLCGDRNPLHSDPVVAAAAGYEAPILHGLCTFGMAGRALLGSVCDGDVARFGAMRARFARTVTPGVELATHIWRSPAGAVFQTFVDGEVVLDRGVLELAR